MKWAKGFAAIRGRASVVDMDKIAARVLGGRIALVLRDEYSYQHPRTATTLRRTTTRKSNILAQRSRCPPFDDTKVNNDFHRLVNIDYACKRFVCNMYLCFKQKNYYYSYYVLLIYIYIRLAIIDRYDLQRAFLREISK